MLFIIVMAGLWIMPLPWNEFVEVLAWLTFLLWNFSVVIYGEEKMRDLGLKPVGTKFFRALWWFALIWMLCWIFTNLTIPVFLATAPVAKRIEIVLTAGSLLWSLSILFIIGFTTRTLCVTEFRRKVGVKDCFSTFCEILFFPIGIWFLQPRVRKLLAEEHAFLEVNPD